MPGLTLSRLSTKSRQALGGCRQKLTTGIGIDSRERCERAVRPLCPKRGKIQTDAPYIIQVDSPLCRCCRI